MGKNKIILIASGVLLTISVLVVISGSGKDKDHNDLVRVNQVRSSSNNVLRHLNNLYVFDLSNRTLKDHKRVVNDSKIASYFVNEIDKKFRFAFHRKSPVNKDIHRIQATSREMYSKFNINADNLTCDLSEYKRPVDLSNFLFDRDKDGDSFTKWKDQSLEEFNQMYTKAQKQSRGADLFNYVKDCHRYFGKTLPDIKMGKSVRKSEYQENLFLITDGYIEYGQYSNDRVAPFLSSKRIQSFRNHFNKESDGRSLEEFFADENYGITPVFSEANKNINVMIIGVEDRSVDEFGLAKKGIQLKDKEILELFWIDWLTKSGFKKVEILPTLTSVTELDKSVIKFINE